MVKIKHTLEKILGSREHGMKTMMTEHLSKVSTKKPTAPLLGAKTAAELFVHVIRNSPCVRGVSATIMHSCAVQRKTHLNRL